MGMLSCYFFNQSHLYNNMFYFLYYILWMHPINDLRLCRVLIDVGLNTILYPSRR